MKTLEYNFMDKSEWPRGEWDEEPDKLQWQDLDTGYPCLIVRNRLGALCGYVGLSEAHKSYGKDYDDASDLEVHGDLTFAGFCQEWENGICHVPEPGEPERVWWLGFDCIHGMDYAPGMYKPQPAHLFSGYGVVYRDLAYVKGEVASLAKQLKERET